MIVIRIQMNVQPEMREAFLGLLQQEAVSVRRLEGCLQFEVFEKAGDENALFLYEEWQTLANFDTYRNSGAFKANGQKLFPMMNGNPDSAYYSAEVFS
jgi:quinol monooxygenase YgiN